VNAEFNWWLLIVGLVVGAGLVWVVVMDSRRREIDVDETERPREALWLSQMLADEGRDVSPDTADRLLVLHRSYLEAPPPDEPPDEAEPDAAIDDPPGERGLPGRPARASERAADDRIGLERGAPDRGR
jgi:hypothetical protein